VDLGAGKRRSGGSALAQAYGQIGDDCPDVDGEMLKGLFNTMMRMHDKQYLSAGHDISDGGIATTLLEMAFAGNCGIEVDLTAEAGVTAMDCLFAEEGGVVLEVDPINLADVLAAFNNAGVPAAAVGKVTAGMGVSIKVNGKVEVSGETPALRDVWEATSFELEKLQSAEATRTQEQAGLKARTAPKWDLTYTPVSTPRWRTEVDNKHKVAIIREEGSNGDREMAAVMFQSGLEPWDVTMSDLAAGRATLDQFRGIVFVGGFSYADVLDSAKGWAGGIRFNPSVKAQFEAFYNRTDTFSLGVCNGCQLSALLGWVPCLTPGSPLPDLEQPRLVHNESGRFESRWSMVQVQKDSKSILLKGMEGSTMGIWVQHGEGKVHFPNETVKQTVLQNGLAPIRYVDDSGAQTEAYPFCPNGSPEGIAALSSADGRHLAMMPHPERAFLGWQIPYAPASAGIDPKGMGPWVKLFQNAREWCDAN